jgi:hypothetical protein
VAMPAATTERASIDSDRLTLTPLMWVPTAFATGPNLPHAASEDRSGVRRRQNITAWCYVPGPKGRTHSALRRERLSCRALEIEPADPERSPERHRTATWR